MQTVALLVLLGNIIHTLQYASFIETSTTFNHMIVHPKTGIVYIGAVNYLFQLTSDLKLLCKAETGPVSDSPKCLPPIIPKECPDAQFMNNTNKILALVDHRSELITCGSVLQGICEKRSLESVDNITFRTENPVDSQYVAANDPKVTTVALVEIANGKAVLFVGRGHTNRALGGVPPITVRHLDGSSNNIFSNEDMGKLVVGSFSEYNNHFVKIFTYDGHIFFLFFRRDLRSKMEYKTYVSRLCINDLHFYSYVEVPLSCTSEEGVNFNLAQSAHLSVDSNEAVLIVTMTVGQASTPVPTQESALCMYYMKMINERIEWARSLCYKQEGKNENELSYIEYEVKSYCQKLPEDSTVKFPCGDEHTPSPIATKEAVSASPALCLPTQLSAVITTTEGNHTVAFLGDISGFLYKVYLKSWTEGEVYSKILVAESSAVNADLYLDAGKDYLYVMTYSEVKKIPVSECFQYGDCASCLQNRDPYCGWCVLEGRCSRKPECSGSEKEFHWLWSYSEGIQCLTVQTVLPANQSRTVVKKVMLTLNHLPSLAEDEHFNCSFGQFKTNAAVMGTATVICESPPINDLPPNELHKGE
ncbi:plexin-B3-like [Protopterus annectens]|uniref:plexin-B3-like n=1 Tax=Protopterus annectens TaxID=7888 RepID=UPI001CF9E69C|nr:plexin-B3-like [Protopterus annectens]